MREYAYWIQNERAGVKRPGPDFLDRLIVSPMADGFTWYLEEGFRYRSLVDPNPGTITVVQRFETDFASIPSPLTVLLPKWSVYGPAAVVHDWLYWEQTKKRAEADAVFLEAMNTLNVPVWKRLALFAGVRIFGGWAWWENKRLKLLGVTRMRPPRATWPAFPTWHRNRVSLASWITRRPGSVSPLKRLPRQK